VSKQDIFKQLDAFIENNFDGENEADLEKLIEQFLQSQSADDAKILRRKFKAFNQNHNQAADVLSDMMQGVVSQLGELESGQILDKYRIIERLADGGMGEVYLAERSDGQFDKQIALKILSKGLMTEETIQRFLRERQILASLKHANIAPLYDAGVTTNNRPWFALEFINGVSIDQYCQQNKLSIEQIVIMFIDVCAAVSYAHSKGVVHRDLKPANILIDTQEQAGKPMVLDFGIASDHQAQAMTSTGQIMGTPGYMSPEQTLGKTARLDGRSDIFSLGVILYKLLSSTHPFKSDSITETNYNVLKQDPPHLSPSKISPNLIAIVHKCLAKDPVHRYQSVKELSNDLNSFLAGDPVKARNINSLQRIQSKIRKHPWGSLLTSLLLLVIVVSTWMLISQKFESNKYAQRVQKYAFISKEIEQKVRQQHMLPHHNLADEYSKINDSLANMLSLIDENDSLSNGPLYATMGQAYMLMNQSEKSVKSFQKAQSSGFTNPENEIQYGLALAMYWQQHKPASQQITDVEKRQAYIEELNENYLQPATLKLEENLQSSSHTTYLKAYIAYLKKDFETATKYSLQAFDENNGLYEALQLAGKVYTDKGKIHAIAGQSEKALIEYNKAAEVFNRALNIGRSDLKSHNYNCELLKTRLHAHIVGSNDLIEENTIQAEAACQLADQILPNQLSVLISLAEVYSHWSSWLIDINKEFLPQINRMLDYAKKAHNLAPKDIDVLSLLVVGLIHQSSPSNDQLSDAEKIDLLKEARRYAEMSVEINPQDAYNWANLGDIEFSVANRSYQHSDIRNNITSAVNAYEQSDKLLPSYAWRYMIARSYQILTEYYLFHKNYSQAQQAVHKSVENYTKALDDAKDFATGWAKHTEAIVLLIKINEQLKIDNKELTLGGLKTLEKSCQLYGKRGDFPDDLYQSIKFFVDQSLSISSECPNQNGL
jgi:serine/threonine protein kinase